MGISNNSTTIIINHNHVNRGDNNTAKKVHKDSHCLLRNRKTEERNSLHTLIKDLNAAREIA